MPAPGRPSDVWWLGFDMGHAWDVLPGMDARLRAIGAKPTLLGPSNTITITSEHLQRLGSSDDLSLVTYKTVEYVRAECASLVQQVAQGRHEA